MSGSWKRTGGRSRRWVPVAIVALALFLVAAAAGHGYWGPSFKSANPVYAPSFVPFCHPCFGDEPIAVSTWRPAYQSHVPCFDCFGNPYGPLTPTGGGTSSSTDGNVTVNNTVNVYQQVVTTPNGRVGNPWDNCRCYPAGPAGGYSAYDVNQTVDVTIDVDVIER